MNVRVQAYMGKTFGAKVLLYVCNGSALVNNVPKWLGCLWQVVGKDEEIVEPGKAGRRYRKRHTKALTAGIAQERDLVLCCSPVRRRYDGRFQREPGRLFPNEKARRATDARDGAALQVT